jgi:type I restriction enzyme S subunit
MKEGWQTNKLGDVCGVIGGGTPSKDNAHSAFYSGDIRWATVRDMKSDLISDTEFKITKEAVKGSSTNVIPKGNVVIATRVGLGKVCLIEHDTAINQDLRGIVPKDAEKLAVPFLFWWLKSVAHLIEQEGTGATVKGVKLPFIKSLEIPDLPLPEQQRIVAILDEAFEGIATAADNAKKNLNNARELFDSTLQSIFTDALQSGELVTLADLATDITDGDHMPPPKAPSGVPFITIRNIDKRTREIDFADTFMVSREYFDRLKSNKKPEKGDVLYTVTGSFGIPVLVDEHRDFCFQRHIGLVRPKPEVSSEWLYYLLMSPQVLRQANDGATGTAQKTVSLKLLRNFQVPRIPLPLQRETAAKLNAISKEAQRLEAIYQQKLALLAELKKSLLHQAFSGALTH